MYEASLRSNFCLLSSQFVFTFMFEVRLKPDRTTNDERRTTNDEPEPNLNLNTNREARSEKFELQICFSVYFLLTRAPSASCSTLLVATFSPALRPVLISTRLSTVCPMVTIRSSARSPLRT